MKAQFHRGCVPQLGMSITTYEDPPDVIGFSSEFLRLSSTLSESLLPSVGRHDPLHDKNVVMVSTIDANWLHGKVCSQPTAVELATVYLDNT